MYEYSLAYTEQFEDLGERQFREKVLPGNIIRTWQHLLQEIKDGYDGIPPELDNSLDLIRDPIDTFLVDEILNTFSEHHNFKKTINNLDEEFIALTQNNPRNVSNGRDWWSNRILRYSKKDYAAYFTSDYYKDIGINVHIVE